jgi:hypothetical protein
MSGGMNHSARCFAPGSAGILPALAVEGANARCSDASFASLLPAGKMPALPGVVTAATVAGSLMLQIATSSFGGRN